jgi:hypothetical protein
MEIKSESLFSQENYTAPYAASFGLILCVRLNSNANNSKHTQKARKFARPPEEIIAMELPLTAVGLIGKTFLHLARHVNTQKPLSAKMSMLENLIPPTGQKGEIIWPKTSFIE